MTNDEILEQVWKGFKLFWKCVGCVLLVLLVVVGAPLVSLAKSSAKHGDGSVGRGRQY